MLKNRLSLKKHLKRISALTLAVALLFGMFVFGAAINPAKVSAVNETPVISVRSCPVFGKGSYITGSVYYPSNMDLNIDPSQYHVACFIHHVEYGWFIKPYEEKDGCHSYVVPSSNGNFSIDICTGGEGDKQVDEIRLYLVPGNYIPRDLSGTQSNAYAGSEITITRPTDGSAITISPRHPIKYPSNYHSKPSGINKQGRLLGLCIGPYLTKPNGSVLTDSEIHAQYDSIMDFGSAVRGYASAEPSSEALYRIAKEDYGFDVLGCAYLNGNSTHDQNELDALIAHCNAGYVDAAIVGNEVLLNRSSFGITPTKLIQYINYVRDRTNVPVTTAETWNVLVENIDVCDACDFLLPHIYPFHTGNSFSSIDAVKASYRDSLDRIRSIDPDKEIVVGEVGWPTAGSDRNAVGSMDNAVRSFRAVEEVSRDYGIMWFHFNAWDENWKYTATNNEYDRHWGLLQTDLQIKSGFVSIIEDIIRSSQPPIVLNKTELVLLPGVSATLTAKNNTGSGTVNWTSSSTSVATVDNSSGTPGKVKGIKKGTATITASVNGESATCAVTVLDPAAFVPTNLTTEESYNSVVLSFTGAENAKGYYIYRSETENGNYDQIASTTKTTYTDEGLTVGKTYYYKVAAYITADSTECPGSLSRPVSCTLDPASLTGVEGFVYRLYKVCMNREPDANGFSYWGQELTSGRQTGTQVAYSFVFSNEFKKKNLCNEHYLRQIYVAIMGRDADEDGLNHWLGQMRNGMTREAVFNSFTTSREFRNICSSYGINAGNSIALPQYGTVPTGPCSVCGKKDNVTQFVERMYTEVLGRNPDAAGLQDWTTRLWNHTATGRSVATSFIFSGEYIRKNTSNEAYVKMLYRTMMNRDADAGGLNDWLTRMKNGSSRQDVFNSFVSSNEFNKICNNYGITRG